MAEADGEPMIITFLSNLFTFLSLLLHNLKIIMYLCR